MFEFTFNFKNSDPLYITHETNYIDNELAQLFSACEPYKKPKDLSPFPLLGLPGWDKNNELESFYDNVRYFRPGRMKK